jgi:hypothetical protein
MAIKPRLGDLLVKDGLITESDLRTMLAQQKQHGGKLGEHLVRVNLCTEAQIAQALARQMGMPFNDLSEMPPPAIAKIIPRQLAERLQVLAVGNDPFAKRLPVVIADPTNAKMLIEVERAVGRPLSPQVAPALALRRAIENAYYSLDLRDEGTSEFQITGLGGQVKKVKVGRAAEEDVQELGEADLEPMEGEPVEEAQPAPARVAQPMRVAPAGRVAPPVRAAPQAAASDSGEEALRMVWALADLLIERGYFTRLELTKHLREK